MPSISDIRRLAGLATLLLITHVGAEAVPSENSASEGEIVLRADRAILSQQEGTGLYEGNAELIQGQRSLKADRIQITLKDGKPSKVEATGNPVELLDGGELSARAGKLVYDIEGRRILLSKQARINHLGRTFEGAELVYELDSRRISARGGDDDGDGDGRIRLVIPAEDGVTAP